MPSNRRLKTTALLAILAVLVLLYVTTGHKSTVESPFYTRTVAAIKAKQDAAAREAEFQKTKEQVERVARIEEEHDRAMAAQADKEKAPLPGSESAVPAAAVDAHAGPEQRPMREDAPSSSDKEASVSKSHDKPFPIESEKSVAGRKMMKDGKVVSASLEKAAGEDGVAKVGNVDVKNAEEGDHEHDDMAQKVEEEMNSILKKGPVIIFSKSYCPYSKKAKHILLDLYTITPAPYVVELDQHPLGPEIQAALGKTTGRRTVPNILINGRSVGGGDDIQQLHEDMKVAETLTAMGGKRVDVKANPGAGSSSGEDEKRGLKFKG